jgi:hypothetical protein
MIRVNINIFFLINKKYFFNVKKYIYFQQKTKLQYA